MRFLRIVSALLLSISSLAIVVGIFGQDPTPLTITTVDLPKGKIGIDYTAKLSAAGGTAPLTWSWSVAPPNLPNGLQLAGSGDEAGTIAGRPTEAVPILFTAQVSDKNHKSEPRQFKIVVDSNLSISTNTLPDGKVGADYSTELSTTGESGAVTWKTIKGTLPPGLQPTPASETPRVIKGKPTKSGTFEFAAEATDASGTTATQDLKIVVDPEQGSAIPSLLCCETKRSTSGNATSTTDTSNINMVEVVLMMFVGLSYWLAMVVVRWNRVARPSREFLRAKIASDRAELFLLPDQPNQNPSDWRNQINEFIEQAGREISPTVVGRSKWYRLANFLFWSRGEEMAAWTRLHSAEVKMAQYTRADTVTTRLESAEQQLRTFEDPACIALANNIHQALTATNTPSDSRFRALLAGALTSVYQHSDASASDDISWQNKASWLVGCGVFLLIVLTISVPNHSILLIVGGVGGLVSRMTRSLDRKSVPTDYGASWTTLFLSPVSGALGAWAGVLLAEFAVSLEVLGNVFKSDFANSCNTHTLAIAFIFGFSERLLDGVLDKLEEKTGAVPPRVAATAPAQTSAGLTGSSALSITTAASDLPNGKVGSDYTATLSAAGGTGTLTWSVDPTKLPDGLQLAGSGAQAGAITGKPTKAGTFSFTAQVSDQSNVTANQALSITVDNGTAGDSVPGDQGAGGTAGLAITAKDLPNGKIGSDYSGQLNASGASGELNWSVSEGALPDGLQLTASGAQAGAITGKPTKSGTFTFTVQANDQNNKPVTQRLSIVIEDATADEQTG